MTLDTIGLYTLGALISSSWIMMWFETTLAVHIFKFLRISKDDIWTYDDWADDLLVRFEFFGELLTCPLCFGFWTSAAVSTAIVLINGLSWWFVLASSFSWPIIIFVFYQILTKRH